MKITGRLWSSAIATMLSREPSPDILTDSNYTAVSEKTDPAYVEPLPHWVDQQLKQLWLVSLDVEKHAVADFINITQAAMQQSWSVEEKKLEIERARATCTEMVSNTIKSQISGTKALIRELPEHQRATAARHSSDLTRHVQGFLKLTMEAVGIAAEVCGCPSCRMAADMRLARAVESAYNDGVAELE